MTYLSIQDDYIYKKIYKNVYDESMREINKRTKEYFESKYITEDKLLNNRFKTRLEIYHGETWIQDYDTRKFLGQHLYEDMKKTLLYNVSRKQIKNKKKWLYDVELFRYTDIDMIDFYKTNPVQSKIATMKDLHNSDYYKYYKLFNYII